MSRKIKQAAVIGSGVMGGGIAALLASAGVKTLLLDIVPFNLTDEEKKDPAARNRIVKMGYDTILMSRPAALMHPDDAAMISIGNMEDDFDKLAECDWIIEVVVENLKIKQELFKRIEPVRKPGSIVSSNTSGIPLKDMSAGLSQEFKQHFLGTHFFNPVRYMHLLEIIPGEETRDDVLSFIAEFGEKNLGKGIVWAKDTPNFIGNRIGVGLIGEAFQLLMTEDITIPEFDATYGPATGMPKTAVFALTDLVGLDTLGHLMDNSYKLLEDDERREIYQKPDFVAKMLENGQLGNKTREKGGFYKSVVDPNTWKKSKLVLDIKTGEYVEFDRKAIPEVVKAAKAQKTLAEKQKAILYNDSREAQVAWKLASRAFCYAANRIPEIADSVVDIDNAMRWGYALEVGPFESWDNIGVKESVAKMEQDGIAVPENVKKMLEGGNESFYRIENGKKQYFDFASGSYKDIVQNEKMIFLADLKADNKEVMSNDAASLIDLGDGVFCLEFHTKMNAVNRDMIDFNAKAGEYVKENGVGLVIGNQAPGMPGAFSAGGDLGYMGELAKDGKFSDIDQFIRDAQAVVMGTRYAPYPVVAAPYGMTLGGGAETCLAADMIVAHADLFMGLVEIGAGLLPAGGGCTNLWRKIIETVPKSVKLVDYGAFFVPTILTIAQAKVSKSAAEARNNGFLGVKDRIVFNKDYLIGEAKKEVLKMVDDGYVAPQKTKIPVMGREAQGMIAAEMFNMASGSFIPPHMEMIAKKIAYVISGGEAKQGMLVSEQYMLDLEREAFVELWRTENSQKMADHIFRTGKPLLM